MKLLALAPSCNLFACLDGERELRVDAVGRLGVLLGCHGVGGRWRM